jgi:integrase
MAKTPGITARHSRTCASRKTGARCNCAPSYEAWVWSKRDGKKIRQTFTGKGALAEAKTWRSDASREVRLKRLRTPTTKTLREAVDEFLEGARKGEIRNKRKQTFKPATIRQYESALKNRVLPELGDDRLSDIETRDLLALKERLLGGKISDSTVRNAFVPLQAIFRRAVKNGDIALNPTLDLDLPSGDEGRERAATPTETSTVVNALPEADRALWATAFYAGLRRGELRALRAIDVNETCIHVEHGWDDKEGQQAPKSLAGRRDVPLTETLRPFLVAHLERTGRTGSDLVFGRTATEPFTSRHVSKRADEAWAAVAVGNFLRGSGNEIERYTLHEARHSFSTFLDAAGVSETRADRYMGHSNGSVAGRYRHQLAGQLVEDAKTLDAYLSGSVAGKVVTIAERAAS